LDTIATSTAVAQRDDVMSYFDLNAMLAFKDADGKLQLGKDRESAKQYFLQYVNQNTTFFHNLREKLDYLVENKHYDNAILSLYDFDFIKARFKQAYAYKHRFRTLMGALKYYSSYNLRTNDGKRFLERFEDRVVMNALTLANGDQDLATELVDEIMTGRYQPATPTFLNAGRMQRGELVSCFLMRMEDNMESIGRGVNGALQLSKRGGGVALCLTNLREDRAPIKGIANAARGPVPVMKILDTAFAYADQLGQRQGAGAVYISAAHPDLLKVLDTKRENADELTRIKMLSLGVVIPDIMMEKAQAGHDFYQFSPYDVQRIYGKALSDISVTEMYQTLLDDGRIRKTKANARAILTRIAELNMESGYPYILFEDAANRQNAIKGRISMSNLCSEILQVSEVSEYNEDLSYAHVGKDISCNLGSMNVANVIAGGDLAKSVRLAVRSLTTVAATCNIDSVPSIKRGNAESRAIGLGQMNLHGFLMSQGVPYESPKARSFARAYFAAVNYYSLLASMELARETGSPFKGFEDSAYADGSYFSKYLEKDFNPKTDEVRAMFGNCVLPTQENWQWLMGMVQQYGLYHAYRQAVAPNGSIAYINDATSSVHAVSARIERRPEGKTGERYYPAPYLTDENAPMYQDAYEIGWKAQIDMYAEANPHVDQGLSLTLFMPATATTRDINQAQIYAWKKGIRTIYYVRLAEKPLEGTECEACKA
jgi:ribonucleoside-diphosphate reductase alpha chain